LGVRFVTREENEKVGRAVGGTIGDCQERDHKGGRQNSVIILIAHKGEKEKEALVELRVKMRERKEKGNRKGGGR